MTVKVSTIGLKGMEEYRVTVEVQLLGRQKCMVVVGLPDASVQVQKRLEKVRCIQYERYGAAIFNSRVSYDTLLQTSPLTPSQQQLLRHLSTKNQLSNRAQIKLLRLARTISDLTGSEIISDQSIWEAFKLNTGRSKETKIAESAQD